MKLRPYHNPENVDESKVPDGWRFRYANELGYSVVSKCRLWLPRSNKFGNQETCTGLHNAWTYIVPVNL